MLPKNLWSYDRCESEYWVTSIPILLNLCSFKNKDSRRLAGFNVAYIAITISFDELGRAGTSNQLVQDTARTSTRTGACLDIPARSFAQATQTLYNRSCRPVKRPGTTILSYRTSGPDPTSGAEYSDALNCMGNLAFNYSNQGLWEEAEKLQVQVQETGKRIVITVKRLERNIQTHSAV